ncbi:hypothetical protein VPNG_04614 [Cytospora leucostoma]|uniref:Uncharacterized protein n=1 Tax=Cytospora leucostoma TaxID=1230097 RepID=A0A423XC51_9PEZI|nr:hypothetical protein VPNG_04614 [Cytospora leucostoma]
MLRAQAPKSSTSKKRAVSLLELPEDDPRILATLLYIIHNRFGNVFDKVTRNDMFRITILTKKYAMTEVLRPWVRQWTKLLTPAFRPLGEQGEDEALLWISWELGHIELFEQALGHLQETCKIDGQGKLVDGYGVCVEDSDHIKALNIIDGLAARRIERIDALMLCMPKKVESLAATEQSSSARPHAKGPPEALAATSQKMTECSVDGLFGEWRHSESCRTWYLGSVIRSLARAGYYPMPPDVMKSSVQEVRTRLGSVCRGIQLDGRYLFCSPVFELRSSLDKVDTNISLTDAQRRHLQQQAVKNGLPP